MYKLWHKLFGFDYVLFTFGTSYVIRRINKSPAGVEFVRVYGAILIVGENEGYPRNWTRLT